MKTILKRRIIATVTAGLVLVTMGLTTFADTQDHHTSHEPESHVSDGTSHAITAESDHCSSWASAELTEIAEMSFMPAELMANYRSDISRADFAKAALYYAAYKMNTDVSGAAALYQQTHRLPDGSEPLVDTHAFSDTDDMYIAIAHMMGIVNGRGGGIFDPDAYITREEAAKMLVNAYCTHSAVADHSASLGHFKTYEDYASISSWAKDDAAYVWEWDVMKGVSDTCFDPKGHYTVEQCLVTLLRLYKSAPEEDSAAASNTALKRSIEDTYGVTVCYGLEASAYKPGGVTPEQLTDADEIKQYLGELEKVLAQYPKGFFEDFNNNDMHITIYLVKSVPSDTFSGYTDSQFMNDLKVTIVCGILFPYVFNHELMHCIDKYFEICMYPDDPYHEYTDLNPSGFEYSALTAGCTTEATDSSYSYNIVSHTKGAYFMSDYGQTTQREDRAEVFKYMTSRAYKPTGCFDEGETLLKKARIIDRQIRTYFPSAAGLEPKSSYWGKFIY